MIRLITFIIMYVLSFTTANAGLNNYVCLGKANKISISFDTMKNSVKTENTKPTTYQTKSDYRMWQTVKGHILFEYTFKLSYNKLSGKLEVKSHNLVTSENQWYNYECKVTKY